jgi:hypothetical protein
MKYQTSALWGTRFPKSLKARCANFSLMRKPTGCVWGEPLSGNSGGIYWGLFRNKAMGDPKQTEFLRVTFLDFARNHGGRGFVDHKIARKLGGAGTKRFLTQTDVCRQDWSAAEHSGSTAQELRPCFKASEVRRGRPDCCGPRSGLDPENRPGKIYRVRVAAKRLGISVSVLKALRS